MIDRYDVAIAGGGPAGSALAGRLAAAGRSVVLIESSRYHQDRIGESLAPAVAPLLRELGVWREFLALDPLPSWGTRSRWGGAVVESHSHLLNPYQHGWHVDRRALDEMLAAAATHRGAEVRRGQSVRSVTRESGAWSVQVGGADRLRAQVIVDATGRRSLLARRLGARRLVFDRLVGVGLRWRDLPTAQQYVLVEACDAGWWYSAPVPHGGLITMLMTDADICRSARLRDETRWLAALRGTRSTAGRVAAGGRCAAVRVEPATSIRTRRADALPWLAVGDAALAVDPVTGSGVVRALRTATAAADTIGKLLDSPPSEHAGILRRYESARDNECDEYLHTRRGYYGAVTDHDTAFWQRRRGLAVRG
ncbi:MAG TPA: tryptophan 7-halogenase [Jatrophihabitans sp.]|nr:tryptophan 7-halogenase [Jatrophihabitans sp.]